MKNKAIPIFLFLILLALPLKAAEDMPLFTNADRVLILSTHPDDETIGAAGAIQKAIKAGAAVKVAYYTNGDSNEPAFSVYERRLTFRKGEFLHMGEVRRQESIRAMSYLGLEDNDLIFLGYPDVGTMAILTQYWGHTKPFRALFTKVSKVPYPECLSPNAAYTGDSILKDLKKVILDFRPTKIFVSHPADRNNDHRSLYLFLKIALWDLEGEISQPEVYPYFIHLSGWPSPRGYHPELRLDPPESVIGISWKKLLLTKKEIEKKHDAIAYYKSEVEYDPPYLFTFARKNELFGDYPSIKIKREHQGDKMEWLNADLSGAVSYLCRDPDLYVSLNLKKKADKDTGMVLFLLGYSRKTDFAVMPKLRISVDAFGIHAKNKRDNITIKDAAVSYEGNSVILKVPLNALGDPDYVLINVRAAGLSDGQKAWRILELVNK